MAGSETRSVLTEVSEHQRYRIAASGSGQFITASNSLPFRIGPYQVSKIDILHSGLRIESFENKDGLEGIGKKFLPFGPIPNTIDDLCLNGLNGILCRAQ